MLNKDLALVLPDHSSEVVTGIQHAAPPLFPSRPNGKGQAIKLLGDVVILLVCNAVGLAVLQSPPQAHVVGFMLMSTTVWSLVLQARGISHRLDRAPLHQRIYELLKSAALGTLLVAAMSYLFPFLSASRNMFLMVAALSAVGLIAWRLLFERLSPQFKTCHRVLIVGAGGAGTHIAQEIAQSSHSDYEVVGFVDDDTGKSQWTINGVRVLGSSANLPDMVQRHGVDTLVFAITHGAKESTLKAIGDCIERGCAVFNVSGLYERLSGRIPVQHINHGWFISELNETGRVLYVIVKRTLDILFASLGLVFTGLLLPFIALAIQMDSPGPNLYSQVRVGKNGRLFKIYKFRTMGTDAEKGGAVWARVNDSRVTKVGGFLRRTRLDELPQLFNVLRGEMSLVGPRPERPEFVEKLDKQVPFYHRRHMVLPGLTGWAQVNFPYGASVSDALEKHQYDLYYIKNRSVFMDLDIIIRTISVVINKTGAR